MGWKEKKIQYPKPNYRKEIPDIFWSQSQTPHHKRLILNLVLTARDTGCNYKITFAFPTADKNLKIMPLAFAFLAGHILFLARKSKERREKSNYDPSLGKD